MLRKNMASQPQFIETKDEISLERVGVALKRQWFWPIIFAVGGTCFASWINITSKYIWQGEFQIVMNQEPQSNRSIGLFGSQLQALTNVTGLSSSTGLQTELLILQSQGVLRPVFDKTKAYKIAANPKWKDLKFEDWSSNVIVELEDGTQVLSVKYRDSDKNLILPVLKLISKEYQKYSQRDRSESIRNGIIYAKEQVSIFRKKAKASNTALDSFSIRYGIASGGGAIDGGGIDVGQFLNLETISESTNNFDSSNSIARQGSPLSQLASINQELIHRKKKFTIFDPGVKALIRKRDALRHYIEMTAGGSLALPGRQVLGKEDAQKLVLEFKELERKAKRDTATLNSLESTLLSLQLEKARSMKPWELISTPSIFYKPVSPRPLFNLAVALISGFIIGSGIALAVDRHSKYYSDKDDILEELKTDLLTELSSKTTLSWQVSIQLISRKLLNNSSLAIFKLGDISSDLICPLIEGFEQTGIKKVVLCSNALEADSCDHQLLVASAGSCERQGLGKTMQDLKLQRKAPLGLIWIE